jgi:hypothetical protein
MLKKLLGSAAFLLIASTAIAQTIVSTTPENKKVILEEFTGINCVFCPDGHAIARNIQNNNPGNVFLVNIHAGGFATPNGNQPDFRTSEGNGIRAFFGANFYPSGMINRHAFAGGTVLSRTAWTSSANQILGESSYLNMAVEADIDVQTNEITVHVEAYYTANSPVSTNKLNVALLQNNTLGPQTGGNMGNEYVHMHRLIDMITGQWGDDVTPTTTGTFIDRTYTMTIPADHNGVPIKIEDLELVVFMAEGNAEIISGNGTYPTYSNFEFQNDITAKLIQEIPDQCGIDLAPIIEIQNTGENAITSLSIDYSINSGTVETYNWSGNLTSLQSETIELPAISYDLQVTNTVSVTIENDDDNSNNSITQSFNQTFDFANEVRLVLNTDNQGSQCTWEIVNLEGDVVESGGPYGNNMVINEIYSMPSNCYVFNLYDSGDNGGGSVALLDINNEVIYSSSGNYGSGESANFSTDSFLAIGSNNLDLVTIYPNPAKTTVTITNAENANVVIYDVLGKTVLNRNNISLSQEIEVSNLQTGTYFIKIEKEGASSVQKLLINK